MALRVATSAGRELLTMKTRRILWLPPARPSCLRGRIVAIGGGAMRQHKGPHYEDLQSALDPEVSARSRIVAMQRDEARQDVRR